MINKIGIQITFLILAFSSSSVYANDNKEALFLCSNLEALFENSFESGFFEGGVKGRVIEVGSGEPLIGANVVIKGTLKGTATDIDGTFTIRGIDPGTQTLVVSYLGFKSKEVEIVISDGQNLEIDIILEWEGVQGEEVTITAQAKGQVAAINQQLQSNTISNIVSKDRIQELPDVNAAESVGRLPGVAIQRSGGEATKVSIRGLSPKYNTVSVNGVRLPSTGGDDRSVDLSLISSNALDGIEVKKANTPDMDADALGGSIDLKLREAPEGAQFSLSAQGGYTKLQDYYGNYKINASGSNRFFNDKIGLIASFNADEYDRSADKFSGNYRRESSTDPNVIERRTIPTGITLRNENVRRGRVGGSMLLDYKIDDGKIILNSFYNRLNNNAFTRIDNLDAGGNRHYYNANVSNGTTDIFSAALSFEKDFGFLSFDAGLSRSNTSTSNPKNFGWQFSQEGGAFSVSPTFETDPLSIPNLALPDSITPLSNFNISELEREENITTTQLNVKIPFEFSPQINGFLKVGGKLKWLDRYNDEEVLSTNGLQYGGTRNALKCLDQELPEGWNLDEVLASTALENFPISEVLSSYDGTKFLDGDVNFGFGTQEDKLKELIDAALLCGVNRDADPENDAALRVDAIGSYGRDYDGIERYQAAYVMGEFQLGNYVRLIPGLRWEADYSKYNGQRYREVTVNNTSVDPRAIGAYEELTSVRENSFLLPMVHLQVDPSDWLKLRLARTETLTRPDYIQYAPIASINVFRTYYSAANTQLKPALSKNWDASMSIYANKIGLFTVSGFYKSIDDLILFVDYKLHPDITPFEGLAIDESWIQDQPDGNTYINNPYAAEYKGVELDWQTNFWYLPSFLSGLVLNINYTRIFSETTYQAFYILDSDSVKTNRPRTYYKYVETDSVRTGRMPDQPEHIANITLGYDFKGFSARFSMLYQSDISTFINSRERIFDQFSGEYLRFDIALQQNVTQEFEVYANFNNINSRADRNFLGDPDNNQRPAYTEFYGFTMDVGLRYRF